MSELETRSIKACVQWQRENKKSKPKSVLHHNTNRNIFYKLNRLQQNCPKRKKKQQENQRDLKQT